MYDVLALPAHLFRQYLTTGSRFSPLILHPVKNTIQAPFGEVHEFSMVPEPERLYLIIYTIAPTVATNLNHILQHQLYE